MKEEDKDSINESAFPVSFSERTQEVLNAGMTLRDWFAGMALQGMLANNSHGHISQKANDAYKQADKMLQSRKLKHL